MEKQEKALKVWANSVLQPLDGHLLLADSLADKRMAARVRALLWRLYSEDQGVISTMVRLEGRIDGGHLRLKNEVGLDKRGDVAMIPPPPLPTPHRCPPFWALPGTVWSKAERYRVKKLNLVW